MPTKADIYFAKVEFMAALYCIGWYCTGEPNKVAADASVSMINVTVTRDIDLI